jgi:glycerate 2-kinase
MKILIAPTAFKGSLSPTQAAQAIATGLRRSKLEAQLHLLPLADGGDGTLESFLASGGRRLEVETVDALMRPIRACYGILDDRQTAIIEMAQASGLAKLRRNDLDALRASTYGTGVLMRAALDAGARRMIIGLGGSATTDGGMGALAALGVRFADADGKTLDSSGAALFDVASIDVSGLDPRWREVEIIIATDVENVVCGAFGAAAVFAPQKGASPSQVVLLERGMKRFFELAAAQGRDVRQTAGGGAAGGLAAGLLAFLGGRIESGVDLILDHHHIDEQLRDASLVITGEGKIDGQTLGGKAPLGIARRAAAHDVATVALVGGIEAGVDEAALHEAGFWAVMPITPRPISLDDALAYAPQLLEGAALRVGYMLRLTTE